MKKEILTEILMKNSLNNEPNLSEETSLESTDMNYDILISELIDTTIPKSIASQVCSVQPLRFGPSGKAFGVKRILNPITNEIELKIKGASVEASYMKKFKTLFTDEFISDYNNILNHNEKQLFLNAAAAESSAYVDSIIVPVLRDLAKPMSPITLDGSPETAYFQLIYNIHLALVDMNNTLKRGLKGFAILSPTAASIFASFNNIYNTPLTDEDNEGLSENIYFLGKTDQISYYVDPLSPLNDVIVGYRTEIEEETAVAFCPYKFTLYKTVDPDSGYEILFCLTRFGYKRNELDSGTGNHDSDFLRTFNVDVSNVGDISNSGSGQTLSVAVSNYTKDDSTSTAGQTDITSSGSGNIARLFIDGIYIEDKDYTWASPTLTLKKPLEAGKKICLETYDL